MLPKAMLIGVEDAGWEVVAHDLAGHDDLTLVNDGPGVLLTHEPVRAQRHFQRRFGPTTRASSIEMAPSLLALEHSELMATRARAACGPELRVVIVLNNPVDRMRLHHRRLALAGKAPDRLGAAVQMLPELVDDSRYDELVAPWFARFRPWAIHVVVKERYDANLEAEWDALCRHLGVDPERRSDEGPLGVARRRRLERRVDATPNSGAAVDVTPWRRAIGSVLVPPPAAVPSDGTLAWLEPELRLEMQALSRRCGWTESPWALDRTNPFGQSIAADLTGRFDLTDPVADLTVERTRRRSGKRSS